jgi:hypothetical protein
VRLFDQKSERCSVKCRIAMWAAAGFVVASGWPVYFFVASKDHPIEPIVSTLVRLTCPVAIVGSHYPVSLYAALVANVATYALVGLVVETLRRQLRHGCNQRVTNQDDSCDIRIGRVSSCIHPCSGHSSRKGNLTAPGTGRSTRPAPRFGHSGSVSWCVVSFTRDNTF